VVSKIVTDMLTKASVGVHCQLITQSMYGAMADIANEKDVFASVKVATGNGRRTTNLKTPIDSLHFQFY